MTHVNTRHVNRQTFLKYTSIFLIVAAIIFVPFLIEGKTFIHQGDGYHQHYPFFRQYLNMIRDFFATGDWQQWDWSIGLGQDTLLTYGYYVVGDPFVYLGLLFPRGMEELAFHVVMFVRIWTVGASFLLYARKRRFGEVSALAGSVIYAFSHYVIYNVVRHPFFIHPLIFFPLIALGIEKIFQKESPAFFALMIGLAAISNFYFFYMLTIMAFFYALLRYPDYGKGWKTFGQWFLKFLPAYLAGVLVSSVIFMPQVYGFLSASRSPNFPPISLLVYPIEYYALLVINSITPGTKFWTVGGLSILAVLTLPFLARNRKQRPGLFWGIVILTVMLLFPFFGSLMNGLSGPYNRFTFVFPFYFAVALAYFLDHLDEMTQKDLNRMKWLMIGFSVIFVFATFVTFEAFLYLAPLVIGWGALYLLRCYRDGLLDVAQIKRLTVILAAMNMGTNALNFYTPLGKDAMAETEDYGTIDESYEQVFADIEKELPADEWYRIGVSSKANHVRNHYAYLDVNGLNSYASLTNGAVSDFSRMIENSQYQTIQPLRNGIDDRRVANQALGVRYIITEKENEMYLPSGYEVNEELSNQSERMLVAETKDASPFAYVENQGVSQTELADMHPVQRETLLANTVITEMEQTYLKPLQIYPPVIQHYGVIEPYTGIEIEEGEELNQPFSFTATAEDSELVLHFEEPEKFLGQEVFLYFEGITYEPPETFPGAQEDSSFRVNARFNMQEKSVLQSDKYSFSSYFKRDNILIHLNEVLAAEQTLGLQFEDPGRYQFERVSVVSRPYDAATSASLADRRQERALNLEVFENDYVKGTIDTVEGMLVTNIPFSHGWSAIVDGEEVATEKVNVGFIGLPLTAGAHTIEFRYETPFLKVGFVLTIIGLVGVLVLHRKSEEEA